jgi:putative inorganic carbon (HCO3(-)) transporter
MRAMYSLLTFYWAGSIAWDIYGWHDQQRIAEIALLCALFALVLCRRDIPFAVLSGPICLRSTLLSGVAICGLISAAYADFPRWALLEWALLVSLCTSTFFIARIRQINAEEFDRVVLLIVASVCAFYLFGFLARYATIFAGWPLRVRDLLSGFANLRFFGQFQTMTLPLLALPVICGRSRMERWSAFVLLASWWMLSIASGTRGTWLAMTVGSFAIFVVGRNIGRRWVLCHLAGVAVGLCFYSLLFYAVPYVLGSKADVINRLPQLGSLSGREILWSEAWHMIRSHPWLGVGPMNFAAIPNGVGAHPHNAALHIAAEWGLPAMLALLVLTAFGIRRFVVFLRAQRGDASFSHVLALSLFAALMAAATQSLVDGVIVMPYSQVTLMVLLGWSISILQGIPVSGSDVQMDEDGKMAWQVMAMLIASTTSLIVLLVLAWPDVPHLQQQIQRYAEAHQTDYFFPRFWQQGWINEWQ